MLKKLDDLKAIVANGPVRKLVLATAQDQHALSAVMRAAKDGIIEPILIGDKEAIQNIANSNNWDLTGIRIIHEADTDISVEMAVKMVSSKQADVLMKER